MSVLSRFSTVTKKYPILRGVLSYAIIWPSSCLIQQTIAGKNWNNYDWKQVGRFAFFGSLCVAPTLYTWVRFTTYLWPQATLSTAIKKVLLEQVTYGPFATCSFFFGMSLLEGKKPAEAIDQVKAKFLPTYQVAVCFWPFVQTINFMYVPERNRVPVVSVCSMVWCCFLAYMHELRTRKLEQPLQSNIPSTEV